MLSIVPGTWRVHIVVSIFVCGSSTQFIPGESREWGNLSCSDHLWSLCCVPDIVLNAEKTRELIIQWEYGNIVLSAKRQIGCLWKVPWESSRGSRHSHCLPNLAQWVLPSVLAGAGFIWSFSKYVVSFCYALGIVLGTGDLLLNHKEGDGPCTLKNILSNSWDRR